MEQKAGHKTDACVRNCVCNKVYRCNIFPEEEKTKEVDGIPKVPHSHTDNQEEEYEFTPRLLFSLYDQDRENYVQDGAQDKTNEGYNFVEWHSIVCSSVKTYENELI